MRVTTHSENRRGGCGENLRFPRKRRGLAVLSTGRLTAASIHAGHRIWLMAICTGENDGALANREGALGSSSVRWRRYRALFIDVARELGG
jgi:hypothetical protein